jgi:menaquinone-dependent protoporphyrinogen oxidase
MINALIIYGTRLGTTASTSEEIASILREEGLEVRVANAKKEKVKEVSNYDLIIVGSGIAMGKWTSEAEDILKRLSKDLAGKKVALFVSCGSASPSPNTKPDTVTQARKSYLDDKAAQYGLTPIALGFFGPSYDYNNMPWWAGIFMNAAKKELISSGAKETKPGFYDSRDWDAIRAWARELAAKTRSP